MTLLRVAVVGVALYLIIYRVGSGIGLGGDGWLKVPIQSHTVHHRAAGPCALGHELQVHVVKDKRFARRLRVGNDLGLFLADGKVFCHSGKRIVAVVLRCDGHSGGAHVHIAAVFHRILIGRDFRRAIGLSQRDNRLLCGTVVDKSILIQRNGGIHRFFGNRRRHALGGFAGVIVCFLNAVPDGILPRVDTLRQIGGVGAVLAQGILHRHTCGVSYRSGGNQVPLSAVVGQARAHRLCRNLRNRLADGRGGGGRIGNVVVLVVARAAGEVRACAVNRYLLVRAGVGVLEAARQLDLDVVRAYQVAVLQCGGNRGFCCAVIVLVLHPHDGGDGLLAGVKRPGRGGVLVVGHAGRRVRARFGGLHRRLSNTDDGDLSAVLAYLRDGDTVNLYDLPGDKAVARAAEGAQRKLASVNDRTGLVGDRQGLLGPQGNFEGDLHPPNIIVAARFIRNDHLCRVILGAHIPVIDILHLVLGIQQDGLMVHILDCDRRPLIPTVIQV